MGVAGNPWGFPRPFQESLEVKMIFITTLRCYLPFSLSFSIVERGVSQRLPDLRDFTRLKGRSRDANRVVFVNSDRNEVNKDGKQCFLFRSMLFILICSGFIAVILNERVNILTPLSFNFYYSKDQ